MTILMFKDGSLHTDSFTLLESKDYSTPPKPFFGEKTYVDPEGFFYAAAVGHQKWINNKDIDKDVNMLRSLLKEIEVKEGTYFTDKGIPDLELGENYRTNNYVGDENNVSGGSGDGLFTHGFIVTKNHAYSKSTYGCYLKRIKSGTFEGMHQEVFELLQASCKSDVDCFMLVAKYCDSAALPCYEYKQSDLQDLSEYSAN